MRCILHIVEDVFFPFDSAQRRIHARHFEFPVVRALGKLSCSDLPVEVQTKYI
jgi:hypothetical protein